MEFMSLKKTPMPEILLCNLIILILRLYKNKYTMNFGSFKYVLPALIICLLCCGVACAQSQPNTLVVNTSQDLNTGRLKIDSLDGQLIKILGERERIVKAIGLYKAKNHIPPLQATRFKQVVDKGIAAGSKEGLSAGFITELLNAIHKESLRIEGDSTLMKH
jgi:chorismate mutase